MSGRFDPVREAAASSPTIQHRATAPIARTSIHALVDHDDGGGEPSSSMFHHRMLQQRASPPALITNESREGHFNIRPTEGLTGRIGTSVDFGNFEEVTGGPKSRSKSTTDLGGYQRSEGHSKSRSPSAFDYGRPALFKAPGSAPVTFSADSQHPSHPHYAFSPLNSRRDVSQSPSFPRSSLPALPTPHPAPVFGSPPSHHLQPIAPPLPGSRIRSTSSIDSLLNDSSGPPRPSSSPRRPFVRAPEVGRRSAEDSGGTAYSRSGSSGTGYTERSQDHQAFLREGSIQLRMPSGDGFQKGGVPPSVYPSPPQTDSAPPLQRGLSNATSMTSPRRSVDIHRSPSLTRSDSIGRSIVEQTAAPMRPPIPYNPKRFTEQKGVLRPLSVGEYEWMKEQSSRNSLRQGVADPSAQVPQPVPQPARSHNASRPWRPRSPGTYYAPPLPLTWDQALVSPSHPSYSHPQLSLELPSTRSPEDINRQRSSFSPSRSPRSTYPLPEQRAPDASVPPQDLPSEEGGSPSRKRRRASTKVEMEAAKRMRLEGDVKTVADHYNTRPNVNVQDRKDSPIIGLKNFNNWIKSVLIGKYSRIPARTGPKTRLKVLDIGCGKGGDLNKWDKAGTEEYIGIDVAEKSVEQARSRWENMRPPKMKASFYALDCYSNPITDAVPRELLAKPVDVVTMQFCMHYAFESVSKVRMMLENVTKYLRPGGMFVGTIPNAQLLLDQLDRLPEGANPLEFGNSVYRITFEERTRRPAFGHKYWFYLQDAVETVPEWVVQWEPFKDLAKEYGLELCYKEEFHKVFQDESTSREFGPLLERMKVVNRRGETELDEEQWDAANVYIAFAFTKR